MTMIILFATKRDFDSLSVLQEGGGLSLFWRFFGADGLAPLLHACQNPCPVSGYRIWHTLRIESQLGMLVEFKSILRPIRRPIRLRLGVLGHGDTSDGFRADKGPADGSHRPVDTHSSDCSAGSGCRIVAYATKLASPLRSCQDNSVSTATSHGKLCSWGEESSLIMTKRLPGLPGCFGRPGTRILRCAIY